MWQTLIFQSFNHSLFQYLNLLHPHAYKVKDCPGVLSRFRIRPQCRTSLACRHSKMPGASSAPAQVESKVRQSPLRHLPRTASHLGVSRGSVNYKMSVLTHRVNHAFTIVSRPYLEYKGNFRSELTR